MSFPVDKGHVEVVLQLTKQIGNGLLVWEQIMQTFSCNMRSQQGRLRVGGTTAACAQSQTEEISLRRMLQMTVVDDERCLPTLAGEPLLKLVSVDGARSIHIDRVEHSLRRRTRMHPAPETQTGWRGTRATCSRHCWYLDASAISAPALLSVRSSICQERPLIQRCHDSIQSLLSLP